MIQGGTLSSPFYFFLGSCRTLSDQIELSRMVLKVTYIKIVLKVIDIPHEKRYINSMKSNER